MKNGSHVHVLNHCSIATVQVFVLCVLQDHEDIGILAEDDCISIHEH